MYYAAICAIARDEDPFVLEWLDYHLRLGFEHVWLYDNLSHVPLRETAAEYCRRGLVTVIDCPLTGHQQLSAYMAALRDHGPSCVWMAFIDLDEFLAPRQHTDIRDLLDQYPDCAALAVSWKIFGSNGHKTRPAGGVIANYPLVREHSILVKSIVRPERVRRPLSPHHFACIPPWHAVNEDNVPVLAEHSYHAARSVQVNHYYFKSLEDFVLKMERGCACPLADGGTRRSPREYEEFRRQEARGGVEDTRIQELAALLAGRTDPLKAAPGAADHERPLWSFLEEATGLVGEEGPEAALGAVRRCLRYHDAPEARLAAARLHLAAGRPGAALPFLRALLLDGASPLRGEAFACLAAWYRARGEEETAARLERALRKAGQAGRGADGPVRIPPF